MTKHSAALDIKKNTITKRFKKDDDKSFVKFIRELSVYTVANKKKLNYIPRMISYDYKKRTITIEKINGFDLGTIPETDYEEREKYLSQINTILKKLKKDLNLEHNDLLYRNFVYDPKKDLLYIIDFESSSIEKTSHDAKDFIEINISKKIKSKKKKSKKKLKSKSKSISKSNK